MKIVFSTSFYHPYISGLTLGMAAIAEGLAKNGHECIVLTNQHDPGLKREEKMAGVQVRRFPVKFIISKAMFSFGWFFEPITDLKETDRVVLNLPQPEGLVVAVIGRVLRKKIISLYVCDVCLGGGVPGKIWEKVLDISSWLTLRLSDKIVTYTDDYAKHSRILKYFQAKTVGAYPPIRDAKAKIKKEGRDGELVIGIAARVAREKGIEVMLYALPIIEKKLKRRLRVVIAGPTSAVGEEEFARQIIERVKREKLPVDFAGPLEKTQLEQFYQNIDILAVPSTNSTEAFGIVQVEAMKRGVPVVASNLAGVRVPITVTGMGKLCQPGDAGDLAEKIVEVEKNIKTFANRYPGAQEIFDYQMCLKRYEEIICN